MALNCLLLELNPFLSLPPPKQRSPVEATSLLIFPALSLVSPCIALRPPACPSQGHTKQPENHIVYHRLCMFLPLLIPCVECLLIPFTPQYLLNFQYSNQVSSSHWNPFLFLSTGRISHSYLWASVTPYTLHSSFSAVPSLGAPCSLREGWALGEVGRLARVFCSWVCSVLRCFTWHLLNPLTRRRAWDLEITMDAVQSVSWIIFKWIIDSWL